MTEELKQCAHCDCKKSIIENDFESKEMMMSKRNHRASPWVSIHRKETLPPVGIEVFLRADNACVFKGMLDVMNDWMDTNDGGIILNIVTHCMPISEIEG